VVLLQPIKPPGINPYKWVELFFKYRPVVPPEYHQDEFYIKPSDDVLKMVKEEKVNRIENRAFWLGRRKRSRRSRKSPRDLGSGHMARRQNSLLV
jgi:hypothetical protein